MTNFKKVFPLFALLLFVASCDKTDSFPDNASIIGSQQGNSSVSGYAGDVTTKNFQPVAYSQEFPELEPLREMFINHLKYHGTIEPWEFLPDSMRTVFKSKYEEEQTLMDALGHDAYLDQKVLDETISYDFGEALKTLNTTINGITDGNVGTLAQTLTGQRDALVLVQKERLMCKIR